MGDVSNLWAKIGTGKPYFCFSGHTDVVPPGDFSQWKSPPFSPTISDGQLTARGAADMKCAVAAMVTAVKRFLQTHPKFKGSISFLITSDEEGAAIDGTQAALRELKKWDEIPDYCLVGEASSSKKLGDTIRVGRRGTLSGSLKIFGKQGHVAYPDLAINPIHLSLLPLSEISTHVWDEGDPPFPPTSFQISNIRSGSCTLFPNCPSKINPKLGTGATNVIPGSLEAEFNLRFCPKSTPNKIKEVVEG